MKVKELKLGSKVYAHFADHKKWKRYQGLTGYYTKRALLTRGAHSEIDPETEVEPYKQGYRPKPK